MVKFLHPEQLAHVGITLLLIVLHVVDVAEAEIIELLLKVLDCVLELLIRNRVLFNQFLDRLDLQAKVH